MTTPNFIKSKKGFVFVYGTLKVGGYFAQNFDKTRISSMPATAPGTMYAAAGWFPGCVFGGKNTIVGELHEYEDIDNVMKRLDQIENCDGTFGPNHHNLYNRKKITVTLIDGSEVEALTYEYNRSVEGRPVIENGIWDISDEKRTSKSTSA